MALVNKSPREASNPLLCVPASGWLPAKRSASRNVSARVTMPRFTDPVSVMIAPVASRPCRRSSSARFAAGGAASTSSSTRAATSSGRAGASSSAPSWTARTRSAGSGDQPRTVGIPARLAWRPNEPPIAPSPMMPSRVGRKPLLLSWSPGNVGIGRGPGQAEARVATIVVVEDEPATLRLVAALLGAKGHRVVPLTDGGTLAATVRAERPALVLLDLELPGKDGFALVEELRAAPETAPTRVMAFTASASAERERVVAAGFDGLVAKPISPASFAGEIAQLLG